MGVVIFFWGGDKNLPVTKDNWTSQLTSHSCFIKHIIKSNTNKLLTGKFYSACLMSASVMDVIKN